MPLINLKCTLKKFRLKTNVYEIVLDFLFIVNRTQGKRATFLAS